MDNKGFSLVEVIIAVTILAVVSAPVLNSFLTAAKVNSKAQVTQDATSLSEEVMEKVKSTGIEDLYKEATGVIPGKIGEKTIDPSKAEFLFGDPAATSTTFINTPPYQINYDEVTATKGRVYDVSVNISTEEYSKNPDIANGETEVSDASDANTFSVPDLHSIDSSKHLILSWEINSYDESAVDRLVDENAIEMSQRSTICASAASTGKKTTRIKFTPVPDGGEDYVKIDCYVSYEVPGYANAVEFLVYTGMLPESDPATEGHGPNIYLLYSTTRGAGSSECFKNEDIVIDDNTDPSKGYIHNVYVILQNGLRHFIDNNGTPAINIDLKITENGSAAVSNSSAITNNIVPLTPSAAKLYTNAVFGIASSNMFDTKVKDRVYYVTVTVSKDGTTYARLTSTMGTGTEAN